MSSIYINAIYQSSLRGNFRHVLLAIAKHADKEGLCWPSINTIAANADVSRRTAQKYVHELEAKGFLISDCRTRENRSQTTNLYLLDLTAILNSARPECARTKKSKRTNKPESSESTICTGGVQKTAKNTSAPHANCAPRTTSLETSNNNNQQDSSCYQIPDCVPAHVRSAVASILNCSEITDKQRTEICEAINHASASKTKPRSYPAYAAGLVKTVLNGTFTPVRHGSSEQSAPDNPGQMAASHKQFDRPKPQLTDEQMKAAKAARDDAISKLKKAVG